MGLLNNPISYTFIHMRTKLLIVLVTLSLAVAAYFYFNAPKSDTEMKSVYGLTMSDLVRKELKELQQAIDDKNDFVYTEDENHGVNRIGWMVHGFEPNFSRDKFLQALTSLSEDTFDFLFCGNGIFMSFDAPHIKDKRKVIDVTPALTKTILAIPNLKEITGDPTGRWQSEEEYYGKKVKSESTIDKDGTFEDKFYISDSAGKVTEQTERGTWTQVKNYHIVKSQIEGGNAVFQDVYKIISIDKSTLEYRSLRMGVVFKRRRIN